MNLSKDPVSKLFLRFLIPAITGTMVTALYAVADGIFVGQGIGGRGLAAINVGYPILTFIIAMALGLGMGSSTLISINSDNKEFKNRCFSQTIFVNIIFYIIMMIFVNVMGDKLFYLLGSNKDLLPMVSDYTNICLWFSIFFTFSIILSSIVRNDNSPNYAMKSMLIGAGINIVLDYVLIYHTNLGIKGAAYATGIGQVCSTLYLIRYFVKGKTFKLVFEKIDLKMLGKMFSIGFPSFILEFAVAFITILFNKEFFRYMGEVGVSAFSIVAYVFYIFRMLFNGLAQAIQPIISYNYGHHEFARIKKIFMLGHLVSLVISIGILIMIKFEGYMIVNMFNDNLELVEVANRGLLLYSSAMVFLGANFINISYLQSKERARAANFISINRSMVFVAGALFILPSQIGVDGVWLALPCSDFLTFLTTFFFKERKKKLINI